MLVGDVDSAGSALAVPLCVATWPIKEMPHDDVAGFCLTAPRIDYLSRARSRRVSRPQWGRCVLCALIWADLRQEGPISAYVAATDWIVSASLSI
jgi:hypothetical protein